MQKPTDRPEYIDYSEWEAGKKRKRAIALAIMGTALGGLAIAVVVKLAMNWRHRHESPMLAWLRPIEASRNYQERIEAVTPDGTFEEYRHDVVTGDDWQISFLNSNLVFTKSRDRISTFDALASKVYVDQYYAGEATFLARIGYVLKDCASGYASFTVFKRVEQNGLNYEILEGDVRYRVFADPYRRPIFATYEHKLFGNWVTLERASFNYGQTPFVPPFRHGIRYVTTTESPPWNGAVSKPLIKTKLGSGNMALCAASANTLGSVYFLLQFDDPASASSVQISCSSKTGSYDARSKQLDLGPAPSHLRLVQVRRMLPEKMVWPMQISLAIVGKGGAKRLIAWSADKPTCALFPDWLTTNVANNLFMRSALGNLYLARGLYFNGKAVAEAKSSGHKAGLADWRNGIKWSKAALCEYYKSGDGYPNQLGSNFLGDANGALTLNLRGLTGMEVAK